MPTENRSSNTEMVSVQATIESLEEAYAGDSALDFMNDAAQLLRQFMSISTLQHQGKPVARYSMDQTGCEDLNPDGPWVRYEDLRLADPGEVERLRGKIEQLRSALRGTQERWAKLETALLAQLTERDAMLRKIEGYHWGNVDPEERARTRAELRDMLSASAEPKCSKCGDSGVIDDKGIDELPNGYFTERGLVACPDCEELSTPVERDERAEFERAFVVQEGVYFSADRNEYGSMNGRPVERTDAKGPVFTGFMAIMLCIHTAIYGASSVPGLSHA